jgi:hypothetical protein
MVTIWELDFYSRPILDERQKRVWELLICESPLAVQADVASQFQYAQFCAKDQVNSIWLRTAVNEALSQAPTKPDKIRFFRQPMANMITKACSEINLPAQLSRRTFSLHQWLQQRLQTVYPAMAGYQPGTPPTVNVAVPPPRPLPDALVGQQWAFVTLKGQDFAEMSEWSIAFGEAVSLNLLGIGPTDQVPGLVIFSERALPLAAWMSGLDLATLKLQRSPTPMLGKVPSQIILETGISDRWILASFTDPKVLAEMEAFETAKQQVNQVHFLAIQSDPNVEAFTGFWLLQEIALIQ